MREVKHVISEARMIHNLWNILEREGYEVAGEVKVVSSNGYLRIWSSEDLLERIRLCSDNSGFLYLRERGVSTTIDLVATDGGKFIGFEVKEDFEAVMRCVSNRQLEHYIAGGMLDEIYLVVPTDEVEHVLCSYGHYLASIGVGIISIDGNGNYIIHRTSSEFQRLTEPSLEKNESWLRHVLWNYFEPEFDVEGEAFLPKPRDEVTIFRKASTPRIFLQKIDLFLLPKGCSITQIAYNQKKLDAIGIEVKYNKVNLSKVISQLNSYANSGALTKLYLAVAKENSLLERIEAIENRKFGLIVYENREARIALEAPKLEIYYDKFAYMPPKGDRITIYDFGKPKPIACVYLHQDLYYLRYRLESPIWVGCLSNGFYRIIYARLSRRGTSHVIDIVCITDTTV